MKRKIELLRQTGRGKEEWWLLRLEDDRVVLYDADDEMVLDFPPEEADQRFVLPSFWESVKDLGIHAGPETFWFRPDREAVRKVRAYLDWALGAQGPEVVSGLRLKGWLTLLGGFALLGLGVAAGVALEMFAGRFGELSRGTRKLFILPIILGLITIYFGIKTLLRVARAGRYD